MYKQQEKERDGKREKKGYREGRQSRQIDRQRQSEMDVKKRGDRGGGGGVVAQS